MWVPVAGGNCLQYSITDIGNNLALRVMVTESTVDQISVQGEGYVTEEE